MAELTQEEIALMVAALDLFVLADEEAFSAYLFAQYNGQRAAIVEQYGAAIASQITGQVTPEVLAAARELADTAADSLLRNIVASDLTSMGETIADGLAKGLGPKDIARKLDQVQGLDSGRASTLRKFIDGVEASDLSDGQAAASTEREFQRLLGDRRETIARTESTFALSEGEKLQAKNEGLQFKIWQTTGDDRVSDECQANEAQGPILVDKTFSGGTQFPPQHPNCRCSVTYLKNAREAARAKPLTKQWADETAAAKEEA